jgi:putative flippase GtrA
MNPRKLINKIIKEFTSAHFIKYVLIGLTGVVIDFLVYVVLIKVLGLNYLLANIIAISCGIINNFVLNLYLNFKTKNKVLARFISFYTVGLLGLLLSELLLYVFASFISSKIVDKILTLPFVLIFQFFLNKHISFSSNIEKYYSRLFGKTFSNEN